MKTAEKYRPVGFWPCAGSDVDDVLRDITIVAARQRQEAVVRARVPEKQRVEPLASLADAYRATGERAKEAAIIADFENSWKRDEPKVGVAVLTVARYYVEKGEIERARRLTSEADEATTFQIYAAILGRADLPSPHPKR